MITFKPNTGKYLLHVNILYLYYNLTILYINIATKHYVNNRTYIIYIIEIVRILEYSNNGDTGISTVLKFLISEILSTVYRPIIFFT